MEFLQQLNEEIERAIAARDIAALRRVYQQLRQLEKEGLTGVTEMLASALPSDLDFEPLHPESTPTRPFTPKGVEKHSAGG